MRFVKIMMVQTACNRVGKIPEPTLIITDENHHSKAVSYRKIYDHFKDAYRVGVTATPVRLDGSGLADVNDDLVVGVSAKWLIEHHNIAPYDYYAPAVADLSTVKIRRGEYDAKQAEKVMLESKVYGDVISYYRKFADGMQAVCYCTTVNHSQAMTAQFCAVGIRAAHIDGQMKKTERAEIVEQFRRGEIAILCNVDLISEGFDVPDCSCVIMLRPTQSLTLFIQQSMRCMRYRAGKRAVILDHVGNYARHGMPDDDREWTLAGRKKRAGVQPETVEEPRYTTCTGCFAVIAGNEQICPYCGAVIERKTREIKLQPETELQKITAFTVNTKTPQECRSYAELLEYAAAHSYKKGWAYYQAKERGFLHGT